jgi:hypothetical protein
MRDFYCFQAVQKVHCQNSVATKPHILRGITMLITFFEMENRFGTVAYDLLKEIEKSAGIAPAHALDPETRLLNAFRAQDALLARTGGAA